MTGTITAATLPIFLTPPMITAAVHTARTTPVRSGSMPSASFRLPDTAFACTMLPMPKEAMAPNRAKSTPSHFWPRPRSR